MAQAWLETSGRSPRGTIKDSQGKGETMTEKELSDFIEHGESGIEEFEIAFGYAWANMAIQIAKELRTRLAQPEPEPVAWIYGVGDYAEVRWTKDGSGSAIRTPLYTAPPKKEWVGLTDEEVHQAYKDVLSQPIREQDKAVVFNVCRAIEAKLKEKNHADS